MQIRDAQARLNLSLSKMLWHLAHHPRTKRAYRRGKNRCHECGGLLKNPELERAMQDMVLTGRGIDRCQPLPTS